MLPSRTVYVDFDDVLCETARAIMVAVEREFGKKTAFENLHSFDIGASFNLSPHETDRVMDFVHDPAVLADLKPIAGAAETLGTWQDAGFEIAIVTGRPPQSGHVSRHWLARYGIPYSSLTFVDKYARAHPPAESIAALSLDELRQRSYCLAIDDSPDMAAFLARDMRVPVVIFNRPWNGPSAERLPDDPVLVTRCSSWMEVLERFPRPPQP